MKPADVRMPAVRFDHWRFQIVVPNDLDGEERHERVRRVLVDWYRGPRECAGFPSTSIGGQTRQLEQISDTDQRSATPLGKLRLRRYARFNWRVMMLGPL